MKECYNSCISVSEKGLQFLRSSSPDHQPPLFLPETPEMDLDEKNIDAPSEMGEIDGLASKEFEGFSQVCALSISLFFRHQLCDSYCPSCCVITISFLHITVLTVF